MSDWFVQPETVKLDLVEGQWLLVKKRLNAGETRGVFRRLYLQAEDGTLTLNPDTVGTTLVCAYLVDWSLTQAPIAQQPLDVVLGALDALDPDKFTLIKAAVDAHDERERVARETEKKTPATAPTSSAISRSPAAAIGAMSG
jgi:hypothetical protein